MQANWNEVRVQQRDPIFSEELHLNQCLPIMESNFTPFRFLHFVVSTNHSASLSTKVECTSFGFIEVRDKNLGAVHHMVFQAHT